MKSRSYHFLPRTFAACSLPLLACVTASAAIVNTNESNTTGSWALPSGANLLNGGTATPPPAQPDHGNSDQASTTWAVITNNSIGAPGNKMESVTPNNNNTVTFPLDISVNTNGYNISQFDFYAAWPDSGRDNMDFKVEVSTVDAPAVFTQVAVVANHTVTPAISTHTRITEDTVGIVATRVHSVKITFGVPTGQENGWCGYREFIALGSAVALGDPITWTGNSGSGGNANWVTTADNNWKLTTGGGSANFNPLAPLAFDTNGANRNITLPSALTASSMSFTNANTANYTFGGDVLTVGNAIVSSGTGSATFANDVHATTGVSLTGAGSLVFNAPLQAPGISISGGGSVSLNAGNSQLVGNVSVANGALNVADDFAVELASLVMSGGTANFTTGSPIVASLAGTGGSVVLGKSPGSLLTTLAVGIDNPIITNFGGSITNAPGAVGSFMKAAASSLTLSGDNTYTGTTSVTGGTLELAQRLSLYHATPASWTAGNLQVESFATLAFRVGGVGEFTGADIDGIDLGGFAQDAWLGINTSANTTLSRNLTEPVNVVKTGSAILTLTGNNSKTGNDRIIAGTINAANPTGVSINGNLRMGDGSAEVFLNMGASNQFGPTSVINMDNPGGTRNSKMNLRGTSQTVAGLESPASSPISLIQNDEIGQPGYTTAPGAASLTINAAGDHVFYGLIRNQEGGMVSLVKNGPGTQEFANITAAGYSYTGPTSLNEGRLRLNFNSTRNTSWNSNIAIATGATLELKSDAGNNWNIYRTLSGPGRVVKTGTGMISIVSQDGIANANTYTGGTVIEQGTVKFYSNGPSTGGGTVAGEACAAGLMDPSNIIRVKSGATGGIGGTAALGNSGVLPQFAPSIFVEPGGRFWGGDGANLAFVANLHLDGANIEITNGSNPGNFGTNIALVGTLVVGGTSNTACSIFTSGTGSFANLSLGSAGLPGTIFQVADVTGTSAVDLTVSSMVRNVGANVSPLTKTGPGTMFIQGAKSYTGATRVSAGELRLDTSYFADSAGVAIDSGAVLNLLFSETDVIDSLTLDGVQVNAGLYGSMTNASPGVTKTPRIKGDGVLSVTNGPVTDPYAAWALAIPVAGDRDKTDDPDGDGFTNLQEYLLGGSPMISNGTLTTVERSGNNLIVRWAQRNSGGVYTLQEGATLANPWATSAATIGNAADQSNLYSADYTRKEATIPIDSTRKFARVQAVTTP